MDSPCLGQRLIENHVPPSSDSSKGVAACLAATPILAFSTKRSTPLQAVKVDR